MIQSTYKGIEIEMELHQWTHGFWSCDYTLVKHPEGTKTVHHGTEIFPTEDVARDHALTDARAAIDKDQTAKA